MILSTARQYQSLDVSFSKHLMTYLPGFVLTLEKLALVWLVSCPKQTSIFGESLAQKTDSRTTRNQKKKFNWSRFRIPAPSKS